MTTQTIDHKLTLETHECGNCGGVYALTKEFWSQRRRDGESWTCPYCGQSRHFSETEAQKIKRELCQEQAAHDQTKAALREAKVAAERLQKRLKNGVCPCCHRYFKQLHRHMKAKHPGYK